MDEQEFKKNIGQRFKHFRNLVKRNRRKPAKDIRSSRSIVAKIEAGEILPGIDTMKTLNDQYGLNITWLMFGVGNRFKHRGPKAPGNCMRQNELFDLMEIPGVRITMLADIEKIKSTNKEIIEDHNKRNTHV